MRRVWPLLLMLCCTSPLWAQAVTVWTPEHWRLLTDDCSPQAGEPHVEMVGGRNGMASGLLAARGSGMLTRPRVQVSPLRHADGSAVLPASAITIRYGSQHHRDALGEKDPSREGPYMHLSTAPLEQTRTLVARLTAAIPADVLPGAYRGEAVVTAGGATHRVPVTLQVGSGVLPPPQQYASHVNYPHSPDSVALRYGAGMWSPEHWQRLEKSFEIFGILGQNVLHVPVILRTQTAEGAQSNFNHFGSREGMIRFRRSGGQIVPDFAVFERYIQRWGAQVGRPQFVVLYVWDVSFADHERQERDDLQAIVTGVDPRGLTGNVPVPYPGTPGSDELWGAVIAGARERVQRAGWDRDSVLIGIAHDRKPTDQTVAFFNRIAPGIRWNVISHMRGYGIRDGQMRVGEMQVGYHEFPWNPSPPANLPEGRILGGWNPDFPVATICRFHAFQTENDLSHRWLGDGAVGSQGTRNRTTNIGPTRYKIEFWPVPQTDDSGRESMGSLFNMSGWVNLIRNRTNLGTAGPDGLEPTVYLQNNIESIQDTEARIIIEKILTTPALRDRLDQDVRDRAWALIAQRSRVIHENRSNSWAGASDFDHQRHALELYETLGAMQQATGVLFDPSQAAR